VRIVSQPKYPSPVPVAVAVARLRQAAETGHHELWSCDVSLLDRSTVDASRLHGSRQVTDVYLLALANANSGRFVTFARSVPIASVPAAGAENLLVLRGLCGWGGEYRCR
jgi:predicted nucleic acid-binding protein